jgi:hypothetical protein
VVLNPPGQARHLADYCDVLLAAPLREALLAGQVCTRLGHGQPAEWEI